MNNYLRWNIFLIIHMHVYSKYTFVYSKHTFVYSSTLFSVFQILKFGHYKCLKQVFHLIWWCHNEKSKFQTCIFAESFFSQMPNWPEFHGIPPNSARIVNLSWASSSRGEGEVKVCLGIKEYDRRHDLQQFIVSASEAEIQWILFSPGELTL